MFMDGVCLNVRLHPSVFSTDDGIDKLREMIKTYMKNGGAETQFNVVSTETMRAAQGAAGRVQDLVSGLPDIQHILLNFQGTARMT